MTTFDGVPGGITALLEGLFSTFSETLADATQPAFALDAADIAALDNIVTAPGIVPVGVAPFGFATGLGAGPATNYNPSNVGATGDFAAQLAAESSPGVQFQQFETPEPVTLAVWGVMAGGLALGLRRRRLKAAA